MKDNINNPSHYQINGLGVESIDIIKMTLGEEFISFCKGNIIKYLIRAEKKNGLEDYKKARKYLEWAIEDTESKDYRVIDLGLSEICILLNINFQDLINGICGNMEKSKRNLFEKTLQNVFTGSYKEAKKYLDEFIKEEENEK